MDVIVRPSHVYGKVRAPPSKSYSHRAIFAASMADGKSIVENVSSSEDVSATIGACMKLGAGIEREGDNLKIYGFSIPRIPDDVIDVRNSGTTLRIVTGISCLVPEGYVVITGDESIRRRPMQPLLDALCILGSSCWSTRLNGCAPIIVKGGGLKGGTASMTGEVSSQFVSSILFASPKAFNDTTLFIEGRLVSRPYVDATIKVLRLFGVDVKNENYSVFHARSEQEFRPSRFVVPGDFGLAGFIMAAALMTGGCVTVECLDTSLPQADAEILSILIRMGADVRIDEANASVTVKGGGYLEGGSFDLSDCPDLLPVVAALSTICRGAVEIGGVAHARFKESDRLRNLSMALSSVGMNVKELQDGMIISKGERLRYAVLDPQGDHRLAMAYCLLGLVAEGGCKVLGVDCIRVSYPNFLEDLRGLGVEVAEGAQA